MGAPLEDFAMALFLKAAVADENDLVNQKTFEIDRHRQRKGESHAHSRRIEAN